MQINTRVLVLSPPSISIRQELVRKSIHVSIALAPLLASVNLNLTISLLFCGIAVFSLNEFHRLQGRRGGFISRITAFASRPAERGFVWGPVTLGLGAVAALTYFSPPVSTTAIFALAFGDGVASLAGRLWRTSPSESKSFVGSASCFAAVLISSFLVLNDVFLAFLTALTATMLEAIPVKDFDNIFIPLGTGFLLSFFA